MTENDSHFQRINLTNSKLNFTKYLKLKSSTTKEGKPLDFLF